jgi:signal transduction histidine kinase
MPKLISTMEELVRRTAGPNIEIETALAGGLWTTLCDPNQLESAILNLCINARDGDHCSGCVGRAASNWLRTC